MTAFLRSTAGDSPLLPEIVLLFGAAAYAALFDIVNAKVVVIAAVRHTGASTTTTDGANRRLTMRRRTRRTGHAGRDASCHKRRKLPPSIFPTSSALKPDLSISSTRRGKAA
jgi:hypothetical protein